MNDTCGVAKDSLLEWSVQPALLVCEQRPYPWLLLLLVSLYGVVVAIGVLSNGLLIFALLNTSRSTQMRSKIVFSQCASDLLVTLVCAPDVMWTRLHSEWMLGEVWCRLSPFVNTVAVAASTYSLMMLSLDRCLAMKNTKMMNQQQRSSLGARMTCVAWLLAVLVSLPLVFVFGTHHHRPAATVSAVLVCTEQWRWPVFGAVFHSALLTVVVVTPCVVVAVCHMMVGRNLRSAHSLAAANSSRTGAANTTTTASRRPSHNRPAVSATTPHRDVLVMTTLKPPAVPRATKLLPAASSDDLPPPPLIVPHISYVAGGRRCWKTTASAAPPPNRNRIKWARSLCRPSTQTAACTARRAPLLRSSSSYSLRTRKQLANTLVILVLVFVTCWLPYTTVAVVALSGVDASGTVDLLLPFTLWLGHAHSALNPLVYAYVHWASLVQVRTRGHRRTPPPQPRPQCQGAAGVWRTAVAIVQRPTPRAQQELQSTSTNVAALGPFHPRYITSRRQRINRMNDERRTSEFFH